MKTAREAAQFLADEAVKLAEIAKQYDDNSAMSLMREALIRRSEIFMDCAKMIAERVDH